MSPQRARASRCTPVCLLLAVAACSVSETVRADDDTTPPKGSPYRLRLSYDAAFLALATAGGLIAVIGHSPATCPQPCVPPQNQLGIDDAIAGHRSSTAMAVANVMLGATLAIPVIAGAIDSRFHGWAEDIVVLVESVALSTALTQVIKSASARPSPLVYSPSATASDLSNDDASRSFPSGHTAATVAAATSYAFTFWKRHPRSPWRIVVLVVGEALAVTTGSLTVAAGWHYPTDVAAGALLGGAVGVLMPVLHSEW